MTTVTTLSLGWMGLSAISTVAVFVPTGGWVSAANLTGARGCGEIRGRNGLFQAMPAVQVANDTRSPGTVTAVGTALTTDGVSDPDSIHPVTNAGSSRYCRPGWLVSLTSGTVLASAGLTGMVELIF